MENRKFFILGKSEKIVEIEKLVDKRHLAIFSLNSQFYLENILKLQTFLWQKWKTFVVTAEFE